MKLYDCCMYFDEDLILDLRLNILNDHVDKFVIAEATKDHTGNDKKLNFNLNNFSKFRDKIIYIVVDDMPMNIKSYKNNGNELPPMPKKRCNNIMKYIEFQFFLNQDPEKHPTNIEKHCLEKVSATRFRKSKAAYKTNGELTFPDANKGYARPTISFFR